MNRLARLPWLTAIAEAVSIAALAGFWVVNDARVTLSYKADTAARAAAFMRYQWWERFCLDLTWGSALYAALPLLVAQWGAWAFFRSRIPWDRTARRLLLWTTLVGLVLAAFFALAAIVSISATMIG